ncbi:hypothetical protein FK545_19030 [Planococcus glaciei]|nr:hypothetical protein [Planococcus glaciei]QDY46678.1 hypothetical protein FK545_19030 [Planococcus glaciei]
MENNNRDDSIRKDRQDSQHVQAENSAADREIEKGDELRRRGRTGTNNDSSNEPYLADGDTTIRKKRSEQFTRLAGIRRAKSE